MNLKPAIVGVVPAGHGRYRVQTVVPSYGMWRHERAMPYKAAQRLRQKVADTGTINSKHWERIN